MLARLANHGINHPRRTALLGLVFVIVATVLGGPVAKQLNARNAFEDPSSQAAVARTQIEHATGREASPGVIALVRDSPTSEAAARAARVLGEDPAVAHVASFANTRDPALVARDGRSTLLTATLYSSATPDTAAGRLLKDFAGRHDVQPGGPTSRSSR